MKHPCLPIDDVISLSTILLFKHYNYVQGLVSTKRKRKKKIQKWDLSDLSEKFPNQCSEFKFWRKIPTYFSSRSKQKILNWQDLTVDRNPVPYVVFYSLYQHYIRNLQFESVYLKCYVVTWICLQMNTEMKFSSAVIHSFSRIVSNRHFITLKCLNMQPILLARVRKRNKVYWTIQPIHIDTMMLHNVYQELANCLKKFLSCLLLS